jgi:cell division septal protein FtsQ
LSQAFLLNPWVAHVEKVTTAYPARVHVALLFRRPVAMVEVYGGLLPIDRDGVLLPTEDFSPGEARNYPRIAGVKSSPLGPLGTAWGDPVIEAAAKLADVLRGEWDALQLHHIAEHDRAATDGSRLAFDLVTRGGTIFIWGSAPHDESDGEPEASKKLARLFQWSETGQSLEQVPIDQRDLRRLNLPAAQSSAAR